MNARVCCSLTAVLLCLSVYLSTTDSKYQARAKPGVCPDNKDMIGVCVEDCFGDRECPDDQKCCSNGCGHQCMPPYIAEKPGSCPKPDGFGLCAEMCSSDNNCPNNQKCCSNGCGNQCMAPYTAEKPGVCPMTLAGFGSLITVLLCLSVCLSTKDVKKYAKPGVCPDDKDMIGACVEKCFGDRECPDDEKCCSNGCGHQCMPPYTALKPGSCPKPIGFGHCAEMCSGDGSCPNNQKCCSNGCGHQCMAPYRVKPGVCPKTTPRIKGVCAELCSHDGDCPNHQKCCSNGCGHQCTALPKEKPGVCPMTLAGVKGPCEELCVSDFDCPRNQKCCSSICGGRICTPAS